eukprot:261706_1
MSYECQASAEMMVKIFTSREPAFLKAVFYGALKKVEDAWVIGDNASFTFKITKEEITEDDEHILKLSWHRKEWDDDEWSLVTLEFTDDEDMDKKCDLELHHTGIPRNDKHGNANQAESIRTFWKQTVFKGLTQFGNIGCQEK